VAGPWRGAVARRRPGGAVSTSGVLRVAENDPENLDGQPSQDLPLLGPTPPGELGRLLAGLPADVALHLHTSTDWPALLTGLLTGLPTGASANSGGTRRMLLTLHDATPLTGGCAYPLDCPHFPICVDPCPRDFPAARARQSETAALLRSLAPALVSPSGWLARLARQALPDLPARVIPNGAPWPELSALPTRAQARATLGIAPLARVALFAAHGGARAAYKSGPRWPEYWQRLREHLPQALAYAVGGDETLSRDGLTVWPYVDRAKLALLMRAADALLYPTLADNHPLVLLEAAAQELPVASFAAGGVPEIVRHEERACLPRQGTTRLSPTRRCASCPTQASPEGLAAPPAAGGGSASAWRAWPQTTPRSGLEPGTAPPDSAEDQKQKQAVAATGPLLGQGALTPCSEYRI